MPEIKINKSNVDKQLVYKCFLLNVRSHRDYVCLEVENCPSGLDFASKDEFSIDTSQIIMPVLDKIRFNIKSSNNSIPFWFEDKLEVFAEGHQIFPKVYCPNCESLQRDQMKEPKDLKSNLKFNLINRNEKINLDLKQDCYRTNQIFRSPCSSENDFDSDKEIEGTNQSSIKSQIDISTRNVLIKDIFLKNKFKSRSEMLTVDQDSSIGEMSNFSLPDVLKFKENKEKSVQTRVCLGNRDFSQELNLNDTNLNKPWTDFPQPFNSKLRKTVNIDDDTTLIHSTTDRFKRFDTNKKIRYWSLINSARQLMKMNQDVTELNSILKSLAIEKSFENTNLIGSLSPVNLILKLKKLNRSSNLYNIMNEMPYNKQWCDMKTYDEKNKCGYFSKLTKTFSEDREMKDIINEKVKFKNSPNNESIISMDTLFSLQKRMLKMMELFLRRNSEQNSIINIACSEECETSPLKNE